MIDPQSIERVQFKVTRLKEGYDQDQVDNYLDRVADALRSAHNDANALEAENVRLKRELAETQRRITALTDAPTQALPVQQDGTAAAGRLLELAQKTADEVVAQAQGEAVAIQQRADASAHETLNAAVEEANRRKRAAEADAYRAEQELAAIKELRNDTRSHLVAQLEDLKNKLGEQ